MSCGRFREVHVGAGPGRSEGNRAGVYGARRLASPHIGILWLEHNAGNRSNGTPEHKREGASGGCSFQFQ